MRLRPPAQGEQVRVLRREVLGQGLRFHQVGREGGGGEGGVEVGEGADQELVLQGGVEGLRPGGLGFVSWVDVFWGNGFGVLGRGGRTVCRGGFPGASGRRGWAVGGWAVESSAAGWRGCCGRVFGMRNVRVLGGVEGRRLLLCRLIVKLGPRMPWFGSDCNGFLG